MPQVTPLHIACRHGHMEIVKSLVGKCDLNNQDQVKEKKIFSTNRSHHSNLTFFLYLATLFTVGVYKFALCSRRQEEGRCGVPTF